MLIRCEFLTSRYVAKETHESAEWPPHPARLFYALVSALYVFNSEDGEHGDVSERNALEWLQMQGNPTIYFCPHRFIGERDIRPHFVPANDPSGKDIPDHLPEFRRKNERTFPTLLLPPNANAVYFQWPNAARSDLCFHKAALEALFSRVSYLGHSSSLVSLALTDEIPESTKSIYSRRVPTESSNRGETLRGIGEGLLELLDKTYLANEYSQQNYRLPHRPINYIDERIIETQREPNTAFHSHFGERWVVYRFPEWARVPLTATLGLTSNLKTEACRIAKARGTAFPTEALGLISGHGTNGKPIEGAHVAWLALPFVAQIHANGLVFGLASVLPRTLDQPENRLLTEAIMGVLKSIETLPFRGSTIKLDQARPRDFEKPTFPMTLRPQTWCKSSRVWTTVTPMALDRFPSFLFGRARKTETDVVATEKAFDEAKASIRRSCVNIGLPEPCEIFISKTSWVEASPPIHQFALQKERLGKPRPVHAHVRLVFGEWVSGPILLGRSRYVGYGLFRPLSEGKKGNAQ